jgi:hypothetical protein
MRLDEETRHYSQQYVAALVQALCTLDNTGARLLAHGDRGPSGSRQRASSAVFWRDCRRSQRPGAGVAHRRSCGRSARSPCQPWPASSPSAASHRASAWQGRACPFGPHPCDGPACRRDTFNPATCDSRGSKRPDLSAPPVREWDDILATCRSRAPGKRDVGIRGRAARRARCARPLAVQSARPDAEENRAARSDPIDSQIPATPSCGHRVGGADRPSTRSV